MPANASPNATTRQWELLQLIPSSSPGVTASGLVQSLRGLGHDVSKRTVERDLVALERLFPLTHGESEPFDWQWIPGHRFSVLGLSSTDALSLHLMARYLRPILPITMADQLAPLFALAASKLRAQHDQNTAGRWATKVAIDPPALPVIPPAIPADIMQTVQAALLADETIQVDYERADGQLRVKTLHPLGLVLCGPIMYLVAATISQPEPHNYAMHRVRTAQRLYEAAQVPDGFSLQNYIDAGGLKFGDNLQIKLKVRVSRMLAQQLRDTRLADDQQMESTDDGFTLTATLADSWRLRWWLLSKTEDIEVLEPISLRQVIGHQLRTATARYST